MRKLYQYFCNNTSCGETKTFVAEQKSRIEGAEVPCRTCLAGTLELVQVIEQGDGK